MPGGVNQAMFVRVLAVLALGVSLVALSHYDCKSWVQSMIEWHPHSTKGGTLSFCELEEEEEALCTEGEDGEASCGESIGNVRPCVGTRCTVSAVTGDTKPPHTRLTW